MKVLQICPPHVSDVTTLSWETQKSHFLTLLFIYFVFSEENKQQLLYCSFSCLLTVV